MVVPTYYVVVLVPTDGESKIARITESKAQAEVLVNRIGLALETLGEHALHPKQAFEGAHILEFPSGWPADLEAEPALCRSLRLLEESDPAMRRQLLEAELAQCRESLARAAEIVRQHQEALPETEARIAAIQRELAELPANP